MNGYEAAFILLFFATNVVQTITGFGGGVLAMPFGMMLVGRQMTAGQINFLGLPQCMWIAWKERAHIQWNIVTAMVVWTGLGLAGGMLAEQYLDFALMFRLYGGFIIVSVALLVLGANRRPLPAPVGAALLLCAGIMHHIFVSGGPLLVLYAMSRIREKAQFRATINAVWVPVNLLLLLNHWRNGLYTGEFLRMTALLVPAAILGTAVGYLLYRRVNAKGFLIFSYVLLCAMGLYILIS